MEPNKLTALAEAEGFTAAVLPADQVPVNGDFRRFCEENRCGQYGANYSCPPTCGTPREMEMRLRAGRRALVLKSRRPIGGYEDHEAIRRAKAEHNGAMLELNGSLPEPGLCVGGSCCNLCSPCRMALGEPCADPKHRFSCMSAYCVDVAELAKRCGMAFTWDPHNLQIFSMIVLK